MAKSAAGQRWSVAFHGEFTGEQARGIGIFFFFISISVLQRSAGIEQDGSRPPVSAPGAGNAVYHQNGSSGPGRAAIYERKMYLGTTKTSVFQAWPSLTLNFYFFFPPSPFSELKIAALLPEKNHDTLFFSSPAAFQISPPLLGA